jgi:hypothetical protein
LILLNQVEQFILHSICMLHVPLPLFFISLVLNCANISLPHGTLFDCYDELGARYQLPVYVLSSPINLIDAEQSSTDSRTDHESTGINDNALLAISLVDCECPSSSSPSSSSSSIIRRQADDNHNPLLRRIKKHHRKHKSTADALPTAKTHTNPTLTSQVPAEEIPIKFRLSNGQEHRLYCKQDDNFRSIKKRLIALENGNIDSQVQRLFFGGKLLRKCQSYGMLVSATSSRNVCYLRRACMTKQNSIHVELYSNRLS